MRVLYVGPFEHSWGTEEHVARAFEALGHQVSRVKIRDWDGKNIAPDVAAETDLFLTQSPLPNLDVSTLRWLEANGCATASYHLDLFVGLARQAHVGHDAFWRTGTVFTADGDPASQEYFESLDINHRWLPPAIAHDETYAGTSRSEFDYDVVFVGSGGYHKEWTWRRDLLRLLHHSPWTFRHFDHHPPIRGADLNDLYATARVVVGDSLALPGHRDYFSDRYFETVGRGGFLIAPRVPGIEKFFIDGEHLALYDLGNPKQLVEQVDYWLAHPEDARQIARAGQEHVRAHHTYVHRVEQMLATLGLTVAA
jgi:hypothetical protein